MNVVVCLPTMNEVESIREMIRQIRAEGYDLFVVDAGSTDGTREIAQDLGVTVYDRAFPGKGIGLQKALDVCAEQGYDRMAYIDCDLTYPVDRIPEMVELSKEYDLVIGARAMKNITLTHRIANTVYNNMVNILFAAHYLDINSGLRVLHVAKFRGLLDAEDFDIEAQTCCRAMKRGYEVKDIEIAYGDRTGSSKVVVRHAFEIFFRILWERLTK